MYQSDLSGEELAAWATLASLRLPVNPQDVIDALGGPLPLFHTPIAELKSRLPWTPAQLERVVAAPSPLQLAAKIERLAARGIAVIPFPDAAYPPLLRQISRPPAALWCRGTPSLLSGPFVAVVGSRRPSSYGARAASLLARELAAVGIGVVSGGALGIDAAAHEAALAAGGVSVAVLGTGIDQDYPAAHRGLFSRLAERGACVTEFAPGAPPRPEHFPIRNRLISGLSLGVVVVEAGEKSGALITARFAVDQNREVFAVPGEIFSETSIGPHRLIQNGAKLVRSVQDIVDEIGPQLEGFSTGRADGLRPVLTRSDESAGTAARATPLVPVPELSSEAAAVFACLDETPRGVDALIERSAQTASKVLEILMELELGGLITQLPGQRFVRVVR